MLQKMLKQDLTGQIMNQNAIPLKSCYQKEKNGFGLMKDELDGKIMTKFVGLRAKIYSQLVDDGSEDKKAQKNVSCKKLKFENYKNCLEANQLENKRNYLEEIILT